MYTFSSPGGRAYASVRSTNPDPARRFHADISEGFYTSAEGLVELGEWFIAQGKAHIEPPRKSKAKRADEVTEE